MEKSLNSAHYQVLLDLLVYARKEREVTQLELSSRIGMSQSDISKVERGVRRLDVLELRAWLRGLGIPLVSFLTALDERLCSQEALSQEMSGRKTVRRRA